MIEVKATGIRFGFDAETGKLESFTIEDEGHQIAPCIAPRGWAQTNKCPPTPHR